MDEEIYQQEEPNPFLAALDRERTLREEAYLGTAKNICGIPCRQITPRLLAILFRLRTPFLTGAKVEREHVLQFLWTVDRNNPFKKEKWSLFRPSKRKRFDNFIERGFDFYRAEQEIDQWMEDTFMDAPDGKPSLPYVCSIAWMEYSMAQEPFCWDYDTKTADTPVRRIYQLLRCRALEKQATITNRISGGLVQDALEEINSPEAMAKRAAEFAIFAKRYREKIEAETAARNQPEEGFDDELKRLTKEFENTLGGNN